MNWRGFIKTPIRRREAMPIFEFFSSSGSDDQTDLKIREATKMNPETLFSLKPEEEKKTGSYSCLSAGDLKHSGPSRLWLPETGT
jgi:hypothetical protein